jgi:hypothetical protein
VKGLNQGGKKKNIRWVTNLQKNWEDPPNYAFGKTCIEHALRTLENSL